MRRGRQAALIQLAMDFFRDSWGYFHIGLIVAIVFHDEVRRRKTGWVLMLPKRRRCFHLVIVENIPFLSLLIVSFVLRQL